MNSENYIPLSQEASNKDEVVSTLFHNEYVGSLYGDSIAELNANSTKSRIEKVLAYSYQASQLNEDEFLLHSNAPELRATSIKRILSISGAVTDQKKLKFMSFMDLSFKYDDDLGSKDQRKIFLKKGLKKGIIDKTFIDYLSERYKFKAEEFKFEF